jgi:hypothetical protein
MGAGLYLTAIFGADMSSCPAPILLEIPRSSGIVHEPHRSGSRSRPACWLASDVHPATGGPRSRFYQIY